MTVEDQIIQWFLNLGQFILGFLIGCIVSGWFTVKFVVPRIMEIPAIKEMLELWKEGKDLLKQVIENQKKKTAG